MSLVGIGCAEILHFDAINVKKNPIISLLWLRFFLQLRENNKIWCRKFVFYVHRLARRGWAGIQLRLLRGRKSKLSSCLLLLDTCQRSRSCWVIRFQPGRSKQSAQSVGAWPLAMALTENARAFVLNASLTVGTLDSWLISRSVPIAASHSSCKQGRSIGLCETLMKCTH